MGRWVNDLGETSRVSILVVRGGRGAVGRGGGTVYRRGKGSSEAVRRRHMGCKIVFQGISSRAKRHAMKRAYHRKKGV